MILKNLVLGWGETGLGGGDVKFPVSLRHLLSLLVN